MTGLIDYLGQLLSPVMMLVGLPGLLGLVWATTLITNLWGGALMFMSIESLITLTSGEVTILGTLMLLAHALPLELKMVSKCGVSGVFSFFLRIISALILAAFLNFVFHHYHLFQGPALILLGNTAKNSWLFDQIESYLIVLLMITALVLFLNILKRYELIHHLGVILAPYLSIMGLSRKAAPITLVGMTLGLVYGGTLLIREVELGELESDDRILAITSMNLFHSIIEDTMIIVLMGGSAIWLVVPRLIWTIVFMRFIALGCRWNKEFIYGIIGRRSGEKI